MRDAPGRGETKKELGDSIISGHCAFQRQVLPSQSYASPTSTEPFSQRGFTAPGRRPTRTAEGPRAALRVTICSRHARQPHRPRPTPPPRARLPQPGHPRLAGGAARREGRASRLQAGASIGRGGGGSARGPGDEGKPVAAAAAAERAEAAGFVTIAPPR